MRHSAVVSQLQIRPTCAMAAAHVPILTNVIAQQDFVAPTVSTYHVVTILVHNQQATCAQIEVLALMVVPVFVTVLPLAGQVQRVTFPFALESILLQLL